MPSRNGGKNGPNEECKNKNTFFMREYRPAERQNEYARVKEYNTEEEKAQREEEKLVREGGKEEQESPTMAQEET